MAVRIRQDGRIFCAALTDAEEGDTYLHDGIHYKLSVELHALVTRPMPYHTETGEWWWSDSVPVGVEVDRWWEAAA